MPVMETYAPGTFCWADLGTPDAAAAKRFYTALFGWTADDRPMGPDASYTMLTVDGRAVAALYALEPAHSGAPPHWLSYISVASASDLAKRAKELGAAVLMDPFDVLDVGRMALVQDPTGAVFALWEPRRHMGAGLIGDTSAMCWNELGTGDPPRATRFYTDLFGWEAETKPMGDGTYTTFSQGGSPRGGMFPIQLSWGPVPPHWLVYFAVSDCDGQAALVQSLGGTVRAAPADIPGVGRCAIVADPQGGTFAVIELLPAWRHQAG